MAFSRVNGKHGLLPGNGWLRGKSRRVPVSKASRRTVLAGEWLEQRRLLAAYLAAPDLTPTLSAMPVSAMVAVMPTDAADLTPPTANSFIPANGATEVGVTNDLGIQFSEVVYANAGTVFIKRYADDVVHEPIPVASGQAGLSGYSFIVIDPEKPLEPNTKYYIDIAPGTFRDAAGNLFEGLDGRSRWSFTTAGPPVIANVYPLHNATGLPVDQNLQITFSEAVAAGTGSIHIRPVSGDAPVQSIATTSDAVTITGNTVVVDPPDALVGDTQYYIEIDHGALVDLQGNAFQGITGPNVWRITTIDNVAPAIADLVPSTGATNARINQNLVITFNEEVVKGSGDILIKSVTDQSTVQTIPVSAADVTVSGATVTIDPPADLAAQQGYYVLIPAAAFSDAAGNAFPGITQSTTWNFRTGETHPPVIHQRWPANGSTDVAVNTDLIIRFNENVVADSGTITLRRSDGSLVQSIDVSQVNVSFAEATIPLADLADSTSYYVQIPATAFKDLAGNPFAGFSDPTAWNFTTVAVRPTATIHVADTALKAGDTSTVTVTFSEPVTGLPGAALTVVNGTLSDWVSSDGGTTWTAAFTPDAGLEDAENVITLDNTAVTDLSGNTGLGTTVSNAFSIDTLAPVITAVLVDSVSDSASGVTGWSSGFRDFVDGGFGDAAANGYSIGRGYLQSSTIPWVNVNLLKVRFSQPIATPLTVESFQLTPAAGWQGYNADFSTTPLPTITRVTFDANTLLATLYLNRALPPSVFNLRVLADSVSDPAGNAIDGEWVNGGSSQSSGDGQAGGDFAFQLFVLPGDAVDVYGSGGSTTRSVNSQDLSAVFGAQNAFALPGYPVSAHYNPRLDLDGSSIIGSLDTQLVWARQNAFLMEASPTIDAADVDPSEEPYVLPLPSDESGPSLMPAGDPTGGIGRLTDAAILRRSNHQPPATRDAVVDEALTLLSKQPAALVAPARARWGGNL